jgi:hypothetical protein
VIGVAKPAHLDACTAQDVDRAVSACGHSTTDPGCRDFQSERPGCARCIVGALAGEPAEATPIGAVLSVRLDLLGRGLCEASAVGRDDCQLPLANFAACAQSSCSTCDDASVGSCLEIAQAKCMTPESRACADDIARKRLPIMRSCAEPATDAAAFREGVLRKAAQWYCMKLTE